MPGEDDNLEHDQEIPNEGLEAEADAGDQDGQDAEVGADAEGSAEGDGSDAEVGQEVDGEPRRPSRGEARFQTLSKTARELLQSLDRMLWAINPRNDSLEKLSAYLNRYAAEYFQHTPIRCRLAFPGNLPAIQLSAEMRHNIFLAFEEVLANILKHSAATQVSAELVCNRGIVEISISDNGCGFSGEAPNANAAKPETSERLGLSGMHHRLRAVGGECQITSSPGGGTMVKFVLPLPKTNAQ